MKLRGWSLQRKLTLWSSLIVGATTLIAGIGTALYLHEEQIENLDRSLRQDAKHFFHQYKEHGSKLSFINPEEMGEVLPTTSKPSRFIEVIGPAGEVVYRSAGLGEGFAGVPDEPSTRTVGSQRVRLGVFKQSHITLRLGYDLDAVEDLIWELMRAYAIAAPLVLISVALGGWWLARQALQPIKEIADVAERINVQHLGVRLTVPPANDEISRLAQVLNSAFDRLDGSFKQAMRFSADASHELKTPLTILRAGVEELLRSPGISLPEAEALAILLEQTKELSAMTETLLLLSRADAGRLQLDQRMADVGEIICACVEDARIMAEGRHLTIAATVPTGLYAPIDKGRLTQILLNLLDNAIKYNYVGGQVEVILTKDSGMLITHIRNTGPAIPPEHTKRIFERFHRADPTSDAPGHGLGLSLARELMRAHGGELVLHSSDASGTEFRLHLPQ